MTPSGVIALLVIFLIYLALKKRRKNEDRPTVIDGRLSRHPVVEDQPVATVTARNFGRSIPSGRRDWSQYDSPAIFRRRRSETK